jgi:hypothetical protein
MSCEPTLALLEMVCQVDVPGSNGPLDEEVILVVGIVQIEIWKVGGVNLPYRTPILNA